MKQLGLKKPPYPGLIFPSNVLTFTSSPSHTTAWYRPNSVNEIPGDTMGNIKIRVLVFAVGEYTHPVVDFNGSGHGKTRGIFKHAHGD